ncbi:MAG: hypothetical protein D6689_06545 [Deltaproteobacteria bacterium]|nr:MAG: hypothetical protein D6689_06545 [Deltaproteobacteria bacterium]
MGIGAIAGCAIDVDTAGVDRAQVGLAPVCEPLGDVVSGVAFDDEEATNVIDFADHATYEELLAVRGIGPRIARGIMAARPLRAQVDPLAALDAVPWVGPEVLDELRRTVHTAWCSVDDGRQSCCIALACEGAGADASIPVSDDEAYMVLDWANRADMDALMAVCRVGVETAEAIVAARPIRTIGQLEQVKFVGDATLRHMLGRDSYLCSLQGSVFDEWCGRPDAHCACE